MLQTLLECEQAMACFFLAHPLSFDLLGLGDFSVLYKNILQFISHYNCALSTIPQMLTELLKCARLCVRGVGVEYKVESNMLLLSRSLRSSPAGMPRWVSFDL